MSAVEILRQARELIADKSRWTQGQYAQDARGFYTHPTESDAVCWCANGALWKATVENGEYFSVWASPLDDYARVLGANIAEKINDGEVQVEGLTPHEAVLKLFDIAIEEAGADNA